MVTPDTDVAREPDKVLLGGPCAKDNAEATRDLEALDTGRSVESGTTFDAQPLMRPASENLGFVLKFEVKLRKKSVDSVSINIVVDQKEETHVTVEDFPFLSSTRAPDCEPRAASLIRDVSFLVFFFVLISPSVLSC